MGPKSKRFLLFVVGFTLPLQAFSLINVVIQMTPFKLATAILLVMTGIAAASGMPRQPDHKLPWILAFLVAYAVSTVQGLLRGIPVTALVQVAVTFYALLIYYVALGYVIREREDLLTLLWGLVGGGVTSAAPAVLGLQQASVIGRYAGLSGQENLFGIDMTVVIAVSIGLMLGARGTWKRAVLMAAAGIALFGVFLSLSRTAFIAGFTMWGVWVYRTGRIDTVRYVFPAALMLVLAILIAPASFSARIQTMTDPAKRAQDGSIQGRLVGAKLGTRAFISSPLIGVGRLNYVPWARSQPDGRTVSHVIHNAYLAIAAEQGLIALVPYLMILLLSFRQYTQAWRMARSRRAMKDPWLVELTGYALFLQLGLVGTIVSGLTAHAQKSKTAWMLLALSSVVYNMVHARVRELSASPAAEPEPDPLHVPEARLPAWSR